MIDIVEDGLRVGHMGAFAVGIGAAAFLELQLMRRFRTTVDREGLRLLQSGHELIRFAVISLWITGLGLLCMNTLVLGQAFTPKLGVKLGVVALLTANMILIERFLIPKLSAHKNRRLHDIPARLRSQFGTVAGFSAGCWCSALMLGGFGRFRDMPVVDVLGVVLPLIAAATIAGTAVAFAAGRNRPWPSAAAIPGE